MLYASIRSLEREIGSAGRYIAKRGVLRSSPYEWIQRDPWQTRTFDRGRQGGCVTGKPHTEESGAPVILTDRFQAAMQYTFELHATLRRTGGPGVPYLGHLLGVCSLVIEDGGSEDEAIAALLHDAVDYAGGQPTLDEIRRRFGRKVARIVERCSDADVTRLSDRRTTVGTLRVVAADNLDNARSILDNYRRYGGRVWERFARPSGTDQLLYFQSVAEVLLLRIPGPMPFELERTVGLLGWFVACGGVENAMARGGLRWKDAKNRASVTGRDGTEWGISKAADGSFGITVAEWDSPDWYADTLSDAKQLVSEIDQRPPFWRELMTKDWIPPGD
jgi:HD domain